MEQVEERRGLLGKIEGIDIGYRKVMLGVVYWGNIGRREKKMESTIT